MKLTNQTRINCIVFRDGNVKDEAVFSANLNTTFYDFMQSTKSHLKNKKGEELTMKTDIKEMLAFDYSLDSATETPKYNFKMYSYKDNRFTASFVEVEEKK